MVLINLSCELNNLPPSSLKHTVNIQIPLVVKLSINFRIQDLDGEELVLIISDYPKINEYDHHQLFSCSIWILA